MPPTLRRLIVLAVGLAPGFAPPAGAQSSAPTRESRLEGRVLRAGQPVGNVPLELHRVTSDSSGVVAETVSDAGGRFRFALPPVAGGGFAIHFVTADYQGVRYLGPPLRQGDEGRGYEVSVFDTMAAATGALRLTRRDMVISASAEGGWMVNEAVRLVNPAERTLVSPTGSPLFELPVPEGVEGFESASGDPADDRVRRVDDRVLVMGPVLPGVKDVFLRYGVPPGRGRWTLDLASDVDSVNLFVRQPASDLAIDGLTRVGEVEVEGDAYVQYAGAELGQGSSIRLRWGGQSRRFSPTALALGVLFLVLGVGVVLMVRRRSAAGASTDAA